MAVNTHRRGALKGIALSMMCGILAAGLPISGFASSPETITIRQTNSSLKLVESSNQVVLEFPKSLSSSTDKSAAMSDVKALGLKSDGKRVAPNELIVQGTLAEVEKALSEKNSSLKSAKIIVKPLYYLNGIPSPESAITIQREIVISYLPGTTLDERADLESKYGLSVHRVITGEMTSYKVTLKSSQVPELASTIWDENDSVIEFVEPSLGKKMKLHAGTTALSAGELGDPLLPFQWHLDNTGRAEFRGGVADEDMDVPRAWNPNTRDSTFGGSAGDGRTTGYFGSPTISGGFRDNVLTVAVFDSGTDLQHEDWVRNTQDDAPDPGGFSVIDSRLGFDYLDSDPDPSAQNDAHGTAVAGIIGAARNNGKGGSGIAPDVRILSYRVLDSTSAATSAEFAAAITDAAGAKLADIGNHSYGGGPPTSVERSAFNFAFTSGRFNRGMANFVSTGNDTTYISYPALYFTTFSVGGSDRDGRKTGYASWGSKIDFVGLTDQFPTGPIQTIDTEGILTTDIMASGGDVSPDPQDELNPSGNYTGSFNGTSAASPTVAGAAALILAENPTLSTTQLFNRMSNTADRVEDTLLYVGSENTTGRIQQVIYTADEEGTVTSDTIIGEFGSVNGFRASNPNFTADGFSPFYGYGRPNPFNAITQQLAPSAPRDYIKLDNLDSPDDGIWTEDGDPIDHGDLETVWVSDFSTDFLNVLTSCQESLGADADQADIASCVREDDNFASIWNFNGARVPTDDGPGPKEVGYEISAEAGYNNAVFEFDYSGSPLNPDNANEQTQDMEDFPFLITSSRRTRGEGAAEFSLIGVEATDGDPFWNPRGRYLANSAITVANRIDTITFPKEEDTSLPLFFEITLRHEFGRFNASTYGEGRTPFDEFDALQVRVNSQTVGYIYGDSDSEVPFPAFQADVDPIEDDPFEYPAWSGFTYEPEKGMNNLKFRTYRFPVTSRQTNEEGDETVLISLSMVNAGNVFGRGSGSTGTGPSSLPQYIRDDEGEVTGQFVFPRAQRDMTGFEILQMRIMRVDVDENPDTGLTGKELLNPDATFVYSAGTDPVWSIDGSEVYYLAQSPESTSPNQVRTTLSDGLVVTQSNGVSLPSVSGRNSVLLMESALSANDPNAETGPSITAMDADLDSNLMSVIVDDPTASERVFITTQDGFNEYPLFPAYNGIQGDQFITDVRFSPYSDEIACSTPTEIFITDATGTQRNTVLSTQGSKLRNFDDLTFADDGSTLVFSAMNTSGDRGIFATGLNTNTPGSQAFVLTVVDWPNSDETQPDIDPISGKNVAFASNTVDMEGGTIPPANRLNQIYVASDLRLLVEFGSPLSITGPVELLRDTRLPSRSDLDSTYAGGQNPRFSPFSSRRIAFEAFDSTDQQIGEIATANILTGGSQTPTIPDAFVPPIVAPLPTQPPVGDNQVSQVGINEFDFSGDGWEFETATNFPIPQADPISSTAGGALTLIANNNNTNTFGYFESPRRILRLEPPFNTLADGDNFNHYLARYYVRRTTPSISTAGTFQGRLISEDKQDQHVVRVNSGTAVNPYMPEFENNSVVDIVFQPHPLLYNQDSSLFNYTVTLDLVNRDETSDLFAGFVVDRIDFFRIQVDAVEEIGTLDIFDFSDQNDRDAWEFVSGGDEFGIPAVFTSSDSLAAVVSSPSNTLGSWGVGGDGVMVNPVGIEGDLFVRMRSVAGADETSATQVPDLGFRLATSELETEVSHIVRGAGNGSIIPTNGLDRTYDTFLRLDADIKNEILNVKSFWDIQSFEDSSIDSSNRTSTDNVYLRGVEFDLVRINGYPAIDQNATD